MHFKLLQSCAPTYVGKMLEMEQNHCQIYPYSAPFLPNGVRGDLAVIWTECSLNFEPESLRNCLLSSIEFQQLAIQSVMRSK
jgi:hypothetical protein